MRSGRDQHFTPASPVNFRLRKSFLVFLELSKPACRFFQKKNVRMCKHFTERFHSIKQFFLVCCIFYWIAWVVSNKTFLCLTFLQKHFYSLLDILNWEFDLRGGLYFSTFNLDICTNKQSNPARVWCFGERQTNPWNLSPLSPPCLYHQPCCRKTFYVGQLLVT